MSNPSVRRLDQDIQKLNKATARERTDHRALSKDDRALTGDTRQAKREKDAFEKNDKALATGRKSLSQLQSSEQTKLAPLASQAQTLQAQYDASVNPTTGQGDPTIAAQLASVQGQEASIQAGFEPRINDEQAETAKLSAAVSKGRLDLKHTRQAASTERTDIKRTTRAVTADKGHVKNDKRKALKDLRPAEYKMNLKSTNKARGELGLKKVSSVIRPGVPNVVGGQVGKWIAEAQTILKQHGIPLSSMNAHDIDIIIEHESSGNPSAVNNWDSNAAAGHPSEGLMQTIGSTFDSYKLPGHDQILNPVDNIIAGVRYAISRYGSISNVPGVRAVHAGEAYVGY